MKALKLCRLLWFFYGTNLKKFSPTSPIFNGNQFNFSFLCWNVSLHFTLTSSLDCPYVLILKITIGWKLILTLFYLTWSLLQSLGTCPLWLVLSLYLISDPGSVPDLVGWHFTRFQVGWQQCPSGKYMRQTLLWPQWHKLWFLVEFSKTPWDTCS